MTVILIHLGLDQSETLSLLDRVPKQIQEVISIFELDDDLKGRLRCSSKVGKIRNYPCFLVTLNGETRVYYTADTDKVVKLIRDIL